MCRCSLEDTATLLLAAENKEEIRTGLLASTGTEISATASQTENIPTVSVLWIVDMPCMPKPFRGDALEDVEN